MSLEEILIGNSLSNSTSSLIKFKYKSFDRFHFTIAFFLSRLNDVLFLWTNLMASSILSSKSYLHYLTDYINIIFESPDRFLLEHLNEKYLDEIETSARVILAQWQSEQSIDEQASLYIENVGYLNRKIALLTQIYPLNDMQRQRIDDLLFNSQTIQLLTSVMQSILENHSRHGHQFLDSLSIYLNGYSTIKKSKTIFKSITQRVLQSKFYEEYLLEILSSTIETKHRFFLGAIAQLAPSNTQPTLNKIYSKCLQTFYNDKSPPINRHLHDCTLGILSQLDATYLIDDHACLSTLVAMVVNPSMKIFRLPIFILFNALCAQSKTAACYLNKEKFIEILLQYAPKQANSFLHINACLLLGHILSEQQIIKLRISYKLTMKLFNLLDDHQDHVLQSLFSLSIHESIQDVIAQTYQLKQLIELNTNHSIVHEIIWKLSFHSDIAEQLCQRHEDFLKQLPTTDGILENIRMKNLSCSPILNEISSDVSLISSPKDHLVVQQIKENLSKNHFRIGEPNQSHCILLCISEESKHDCACQAAIRQALLNCKKIFLCIVHKPYRVDDWFAKLRIQEKNPLNILELGLEKLSLEIGKDLNNHSPSPSLSKRTRIITQSETTSTISSEASPPVERSTVPRKKIQGWTNREVLGWCEKNNLGAFKKILTLYDGRNLLTLAHLSRLNTPHTIINQLRNDCRKQGLRLSFVEFVRFQTALDDLLRLEKDLARKQSISTITNRYVYRGKITKQTSMN